MSTIDTSTWNPDASLNTEIGGIPLNADAGIAQTWQAIRILMAAFKGDTSAIQAFMVPFFGATASADGTSGLVPTPEAGDQDKFLKGDGTWGYVTASEAESVSWSGVTGKPSTLSGYGITDAYTKTEIDTKLTAAMHYKGSVATYADLPSSGNVTGDFYNITATGENYAWTGSAWDATGSIVDLAAITNSEIDTIVAS